MNASAWVGMVPSRVSYNDLTLLYVIYVNVSQRFLHSMAFALLDSLLLACGINQPKGFLRLLLQASVCISPPCN